VLHRQFKRRIVSKVLVVDDDSSMRSLVEVRLRQAGHRVLAAGSADQALLLVAERGVPDVVVLDVLMPGLNGLELLARLRADPAGSRLPAVFLSSRVQESDIAAGRAMGATYLTKPVVISALLAAIEAALLVDQPLAGSW
jgi:DNA-binding response OmpR family regulator